MAHGIVDVFAYQEALLMEGAFGIALLAMVWIGFRRWLQHKEKMSGLTAEQAAKNADQLGGRIESVEARLEAIEQASIDGRTQTPAGIQASGMSPIADPVIRREI